MKYVLGISAVLALVWLPASGCYQGPAPRAHPQQFGGYYGPTAQPQYPQGSATGVQQYPGATGMPASQAPAQPQYQPPVQQPQPVPGAEQPAPGGGSLQPGT